MVPTFEREELLISQGFAIVAGVDEVGRGPLAGPVMAAAVVLPAKPRPWYPSVRDSKLLTQGRREKLAPLIQQDAVAFGIGKATVGEIDRLGIAAATRMATVRAINGLSVKPNFVLTDNVKIPGLRFPYSAVKDGDTLCLSISAASIIAKVARDKIMVEMDVRFPGYGFARHKGYATLEHMRKIYEMGVCDIHRKSFSPAREILTRPLFEN
jgi:ribonuclease HII